MTRASHFPIVVFDGSCGFCRKSLSFLRSRFDFSGVAFVPFSESNAIEFNFPREVSLNHTKYMYFIASETNFFKGYFAFTNLFKMDPRLKFISALMGFKIISLPGILVYNTVSKYRKKLSGSGSQCGL